MNSIEFVQKIFTSIWSISAKEAAGYLPLIMQIANGKSELSFGDIKERRLDLAARTTTIFVSKMSNNENVFIVNSSRNFMELQKESFAIMRINGVIQKDSDVCNKGLDAYADELSIAGTNPLVKGVLLEVHSGGGTAFGGDSFAQLVGDFEATYNKPISAIISHVAASAAYEIIAKAPMIFVDGETAEAGSIGTMTTMFNYKQMMESEGVKEIVVRASDSFGKNDEYYQAMEGNTKPLQENILDPLNRAFQNVVKKGRKGKLNLSKMAEDESGNKVPEVLTGRVYFGKDIIYMGLADEMGSRSDALKYLSKREKLLKKVSETSKTKKSMFSILAQTKEQLLQSLTELNEKASSEEIDAEQKESIQAEKEAIEQVVKMKEVEAKFIELELKHSELTLKLEGLSLAEENAKALHTELEESKVALEQNLAELQEKESSLLEAEARKFELEAEAKKLTEEKAEIQAKADAFESFVEGQYGKEKVQQIQIGKSSGEQPEEIQPKVHLSKAEEKYQVIKQSNQIIAEMTKQG